MLTVVERMAEKMVAAQVETQRQTTELVLSILQGRPTNGTEPAPLATVVPETLLTPNYDDDSIPLPPGIEEIFSRHEEEDTALRLLRTEQEQLARQRHEASQMLRSLTDPQGPASAPFS